MCQQILPHHFCRRLCVSRRLPPSRKQRGNALSPMRHRRAMPGGAGCQGALSPPEQSRVGRPRVLCVPSRLWLRELRVRVVSSRSRQAAGDTQCLPCVIDTYAVNATTCLQCPEHSEARPASPTCKCATPYVWTSNSTCQFCVTNHFWEGGECRACPVLASSDPTAGMLLGPPACHCTPGHLAVPQNISGDLNCMECEAGTFESGRECHACGNGAWAPASSTAASECVCNKRPNASSTCHTQLVDGTCAGECASTPAACVQCLQ
jgi:hypothetical protein